MFNVARTVRAECNRACSNCRGDACTRRWNLFPSAKVRRKLYLHNRHDMAFYIPNIWYIAINHYKSWSVKSLKWKSGKVDLSRKKRPS